MIDKKFRYLSLDLFDTVFLRKVIEPKGIFILMEKKLQSLYGEKNWIENFVNQRIKSELIARKKSKNEEVTLDEIYHEYSLLEVIEEKEIENIKNIEMEVEINNIIINNDIISLIKDLKYDELILTSDIYIPENVIKDILLKHNFDYYKVYISSKIKVTKATGNLFKYILEDLSIQPNELLHIGDNYNSDYRQAKKLNINAYHYKKSEISRYEEYPVNNIYEQYFLASIRNARLTQCQNNLMTIGASILGPLVYSFVQFIINECKKDNTEMICFLSRDGQIMYEVASKILDSLNVNLKICYLYVSRQSLRFANIKKIEDIDKFAFKEDPIITKEMIVNRLNLETNEFSTIVSKKTNSEQLNKEEIKLIKEYIYTNTKLVKKILDESKKQKEYFIQYLQENDIFDFDKIALVDIGWFGTMQSNIVEMLNEKNISIKGFYIDMFSNHSDQISYFKQGGLSLKNNISFLHTTLILLETLFLADHQTTIAYKKEKKILPILKQEKVKYKIALDELRKGAYGFVDIMLDNDVGIYVNSLQDSKINYDNIFKVIATPSIDDVRSFMQFSISTDQNDIIHYNLVEKISFVDFFKKSKFYAWMEGSSVLSNNKLLYYTVRTYARLYNFRRMIIDLIKSILKEKS